MPRKAVRFLALSLCVLPFLLATVRGEVLLQYFEANWDEIYQRLPEIAEIGYDGLWLPPPCKSPVAGGAFAGSGNVGYSQFDKFDIGDIPQRGSLGTRYGTRGSLRNLTDQAHDCGIKNYPDIIMNHFGNGPDYRTYPGTVANDFHGWIDGGQPGGFKRPIRMNAYDDINNGYGYTFQQELASLIDLQTESDQRFSSGYSNFSGWPAPFIRQPGWNEHYPFGAPGAENTVQFLNRWINWLGYAMDYDGIRMDAPKHVIANFFGLPGSGFLHEVQWNFDQRRGYSDGNEYDQMYQNYIDRDDALIFSEIFIGAVDQVSYWRTSYGNKMRYLDFPRKSQMIVPAFSGGNLAALSSFAGFSPAEGVVFCQSHDEDPPSKLDLAYAYTLTHIGVPNVYFTGNNLAATNVNVNTWLKTGYGAALGDYNYGAVPNLVYVNQNFARGFEWERWSEGDFYAFERFQDVNGNNPLGTNAPESGETLLLVGLNDSGSAQTRQVQTAFPPGTVLKNYSIYGGSTLTVDGSGKVNLTIPAGNNGQGWVCYAPRNADADGEPIRFTEGGSPAGTMSWVVPGGLYATNKPRQVVRLTQDQVDIDVYYQNPSDGAVDSVMLKWGLGQRMHPTNYFSSANDIVSGKFQSANPVAVGGSGGTGHFKLTATITNMPEGLNLVKARAFMGRSTNLPALFQTFAKVVYVDRHGPDLNIDYPAQNQTIEGGVAVTVSNVDKTAYYMEYNLDGAGYTFCDEVMKGTWRFALPDMASGIHTVSVRALEADYGNPRNVINTSTLVRVFNVSGGGPTLSLSHQNYNRGIGSNIELPFFKTLVGTSPSLPASQVKFYWDGFEMLLSGSGTLTNVFDGRYVRGGVTNRLWGCFVNGPHFFEVVAQNAGVTSRLARRVVFNLYGSNQIDSDSDGLPDEIEMPGFTSGRNPGPNVPWPGDTSGSGNQDMIPNYGETWTRLNPMNADTTYSGTWDDGEDWDGDGVPNGCEVRQGYLQFGDAYHYNIYSGSSKPSSCVETNGGGTIPAQVGWSPTNPTRCPGNTFTVTYAPNQGSLSNASPIVLAIGTNAANVIHTNMSDIGGGQWQYVYAIPGTASNLTFWFHNSANDTFDNNGGGNYSVAVGNCVVTTNFFVMDGEFDSANYEVANSGMKILAAVKSNNLYVATWSPAGNGSGDDHFVYITDRFGAPEPSPWAKAGNVYFDKATKPHMVAESDATTNGYRAFNNGGAGARTAEGASGHAFEGEINLEQVFGYVPDVVYIAAVAVGDNDDAEIDSQCPPAWRGSYYEGNTYHSPDLEIMEFQAVPVASIRDENKDGTFDCGKPQMWTVVDNDTNDANYNIRRFFIDELAGDERNIKVILSINGPGGTNVVSDVELISNLNRRDFAVLPGDEDIDAVTPSSATTYYRAYPMSGSGNGPYTVTLPVNKCGAYRINARYRINGTRYYYTDHGLRRDCAVVVTPKKALNITMYELNPMTAEASGDEFSGRSTFKDMYMVNTNHVDVISTNYFKKLGVNMIWLQPIHPIGSDNRETDPTTGGPYDPGSPYAVHNYWQVNGVLGDPWTADGSEALHEFTNFVQAMDSNQVGVMLDGTFNHSAWDCEIGEPALDMFSWATNASDLIRKAHPQWYSKAGDYGKPASYYNTANDTDVGVAPDRTDFGKWSDVADFFFGTYDALVQQPTEDWRDHYLLEQDRFDGFGTNTATRELWEYFAEYPLYWLEKTGHPEGTPKAESYKGIDGLRCDFAQGLPSLFWEYTINKTRSVKWDFIFMAESLDGYREVNGNKRHGLSFRSARHFDVLNENMLFYWRDQFFDYEPWYDNTPYAGAQPYTDPTRQQFDNRKNAYDNVPILLNLTGHDELLPQDEQWRVVYAYSTLATMDGAPMLLAGQESGLQNSASNYPGRGIDPGNNYARYEVNFGKAIPHFKRYNDLTNVWDNINGGWADGLAATYRRINRARTNSVALRSQQNYFLGKQSGGGYDADIFAVAKFTTPGVSAATQEVVLCFVNNNYQGSTNRFQTFSLNATVSGGANWFGIDPTHSYNIVDLMATNPTTYIWMPNKLGSDLISNGIGVWLHESPYEGKQAQFLRLVDLTANPSGNLPDADGDGIPDYNDPDDDNDGLPDWWEALYGPRDPGGDEDNDHQNNMAEYLAGTNPGNPDSVLEITGLDMSGNQAFVSWDGVTNKNYRLQRAPMVGGAPWQNVFFGTALSSDQGVADTMSDDTNLFYRVILQP